MHSFMVMLLTCSAIMSLIALLYMAVNPLLARRYSEKGRYYVWLIILVGLIVPFRPSWSNALIRIGLPSETAQPILQIGNDQTGSILSTIYFPFVDEVMPFAYSTQNISFAWWQIAFVAWFIGFASFVGFNLANHYSFIKKVKRWSKSVADERLNTLFTTLKAEMGISRNVSLLHCEGIGSPVMLGFIKPVVLLTTTALAEDELCFILKHELVHFKRGDLFFKALVLLATAIHWFNPVVYMIAKAINAQCELSCDAEIVQSSDDDTRQRYSETIIAVVRYQSKFKTALSTTFYGGKKGMKNRITSIMTTSKKKATLGSMALALGLVSVLTIGTLTAFAAERIQPDPDRPLQNIGRRIDGEVVLNQEFLEMLGREGARMYELDGVTPFDFSLSLNERIDRSGPFELFRVDANGRLTPTTDGFELIAHNDLGSLRSISIEELQERNIEFMPLNAAQDKVSVYGDDGRVLMWVDQSFFNMTYEEFNELAEQLLTNAFIIQTQETVDILRGLWVAAQ